MIDIKQKLSDIQKYRGFGTAQQKEFLEDFIESLSANQTALNTASHLKQYSTGAVQRAASDIFKTLSEGHPLSTAFKGWFDDVVIQSIRAGEGRRKVLPALENALSATEIKSGALSKVILSNAYPLVMMLLGLTANIAAYLSTYEDKALLTPVPRWPAVTQWSYYIALHVMNYWVIYLVSIPIIYHISNWILGTWKGSSRQHFENVPIFKQYRVALSASFLNSLSIMLRSKLGLAQAIATLKKTATPYMKHFLDQMELNTRKSGLGIVIDVNLLQEAEIARIKALTVRNAGSSSILDMSATRHLRLLQKSLDRFGLLINVIGYLGCALFILLAFGGMYALQMMDAGIF